MMGMIVYRKPEYYKQFIEMKASGEGDAFFNMRQGPIRTINKNLSLAILNYYLHLNFKYTSDGLRDTWSCPMGDLNSDWSEDCDGLTFRGAVEAVTRSGFSASDVFICTGLRYLNRIKNKAYSPYDPHWIEADHMFLMVWIDGDYWVIDTNPIPPKRASEYFDPRTGIIPRAIINCSHFGAGKPNDVSAGFARFTYDV